MDIRQNAGMVFQNPDNQIIGQVVEEDVGFGPENMGVPTKEIWERVEESLKAVGMYKYRKHSLISCPEAKKQRVSIAGVIAMHPKCIILDEPQAYGTTERAQRGNPCCAGIESGGRDYGDINHSLYGRNYPYRQGDCYGQGPHCDTQGNPKGIFSRWKSLKELRLDVPQVTLLA